MKYAIATNVVTAFLGFSLMALVVAHYAVGL